AGLKRKPCISSQPHAARSARCSSRSTPSATTRSCSALPIETIAAASAASSARLPISRTKERSTLRTSTGRRPSGGSERVAGPEVVERDEDAERAQLLELRHHARRVVHQRALGDLELEAVRIDARLAQGAPHLLHELVAAELLRRQVDRHGERGEPAPRPL